MRSFIEVSIGLLFIANNLFAQTVTVEIRNIRNDKGNVLVMAQSGKDSQPIYGMAKPEKGVAIVTLENVTQKQFEVSAFHDENDNWTMDLNENQMPVEGYVHKNYTLKDGENICKMKLYYPVNQ